MERTLETEFCCVSLQVQNFIFFFFLFVVNVVQLMLTTDRSGCTFESKAGGLNFS